MNGATLTLDTARSEREGVEVLLAYNKNFLFRRLVRINGRLFSFARYVWQTHRPDDPILDDEDIHHKDFNSFNDHINNLEKLKKATHLEIHRRRDLAKSARKRKRRGKKCRIAG